MDINNRSGMHDGRRRLVGVDVEGCHAVDDLVGAFRLAGVGWLHVGSMVLQDCCGTEAWVGSVILDVVCESGLRKIVEREGRK